MQAFLVLSDAATTDSASGKINMLGAGWSITGPTTPGSAIVGFLRVPWDEVNSNTIHFSLQLVDDAEELIRPFADSNEPLRFGGELSIPDKTELEESVKRLPLNVSFAFPLPPLPLTPGREYRWILAADDKEVASVDFAVRST